jgi:ABC-type uncharacterized transport system auxiliary subunit
VSRGLALLGVCLALGCLTPRAPVEPRYFAPTAPLSPPPADDPKGDGWDRPVELRMRRVQAAAHLRDRLVWRRGVEIGFYDLVRWTEPPARYAQNWLTDELFARRGFRRSNTLLTPTLTAKLTAFDELLSPAHEASVALDVLVVAPDRTVLFERSFAVKKAIPSDDPNAVADALGAALSEVATQVGEALEKALESRPG